MEMKTASGIAIILLLAGCAGSNRIFDGESMEGWRPMAVHGGRGGIWTVENGALVANQDTDHTGGLLGTIEKFSDFEIELEFQADYPVDSGLFLRTDDEGMGYQITIDYRDNGTVASMYSPSDGRTLVQYPNWQDVYREDGWNTLRARVEGQPAHVQAWFNGVKTVDFVDTEARYPSEGYIGLQVHGGGDSWGANSRARFRNIEVREL
jgi:hypothetical protein